ncbi:MAG: hypothetical protein GX030_06060 [Firmicutes bacterium]|nr:hypothetical protein [Bacillota bacterium]
MMWTIVPDEVVWEGFEEDNREYVELIGVNGVLMQVEPIGGNQGRVVRVISSEPEDYWRPECQPGVLVDLNTGQQLPN